MAVYQEELFCLWDTMREVYDLLDARRIPTNPAIVKQLVFKPDPLILPEVDPHPPLIMTKALMQLFHILSGSTMIERLKASVPGAAAGD